MPPKNHQAYNQTIQSPHPIPGSQPTSLPPTIQIHQTQLPPFHPTHAPYALLNGSLHFEAPHAARYRITPTQIDIHPTGAAEDVTALLLSTALPALLWMNQKIVLHAAAAILPGETLATAIAGPSGAGKSTFLRALLAQNATALADDTVAINPDHTCSGLPGGTWVRGHDQSRFEPIPSDRQAASAPLGRIVILSAGSPTRLRRPAALTALLNNIHRPLIPQILGLQPLLLTRLARLAATVPVYSYQGTPEDLVKFLERADDETKGEMRG